MAVSFDLLQIPFYGLVAGGIVITWSLRKAVQAFQSMYIFLIDSGLTLRLILIQDGSTLAKTAANPQHTLCLTACLVLAWPWK